MIDLYIKKLEDENAKLYKERNRLFNFIKSVSQLGSIQVDFNHIAHCITPELIFNYALKTYKFKESKSAFVDSYIFEISDKQIRFSISKADPPDLVEHNRTIAALSLFRVIWDDYNAKSASRNSFGLLLDIIKDDYI